ncbi:MAG: hypothetical protein RR325_03980 [Bacilli bacterium]
MLNIFNKQKQNNNLEEESEYRKHGDNTLIIVIIFIAIISVVSIIIYNITIKNNCTSFEKRAIDEGFIFVTNIAKLPSLEGTSFLLQLESIPSWKNEFRNSSCEGTLNIIKTDVGYVKELNLENCNRCTTSKKKLSKETSKFNEKKSIVKVNVTYNYRTRQLNNTLWTSWYESNLINSIPSEYNVNLPYDEKKYPVIPSGGNIISYEVEKKNFYSYRDKSWKFYKTANNQYSQFSSTKPVGYSYKDSKTEINSEPSEWSTNYPNEEEYRKINSATGYRFYYIDKKKNKIYYNNGEYTVKIEDVELSKQYTEKEKETVKMYNYVDKLWRWYNGKERGYSSFSNKESSAYPYKDDKLFKYTEWSKWKETSSVNYDNTEYREEKIDIHNRFRAKYAIDSLDMLNEYLNIIDFETSTNRAVSDMKADEKINVLIKYGYRYGK